MEYILGFIVIALLVERYLSELHHTKRYDDLIRGILSKTSEEYAVSKVIQEDEEIKEEEDDLRPLHSLDDEEFMELINKN